MEIRNFNYTAILGWSVSRYETFTKCKRQYYYQYYGKYDWEQSEQISQLKNLTSIPLAIGNIVHDAIKTVLQRLQKTIQPIDSERFRTFLYNKAEKQSKENSFSEVYYGQMEAIEVRTILPQIQYCLDNFLKSSRFEWIKHTAILTKDQWIIEPPGFGEARLGDLKIHAKVDFLFPTKDKIVIIDWKTGKPDNIKHPKQLTGYAAWAAYHDNVPANSIDPVAIYLQPVYQETGGSLNDNDLAMFRDQIKKETQEMYSFCRDINENIPLEKPRFPMTNNTRWCKFCNFRQLCNR